MTKLKLTPTITADQTGLVTTINSDFTKTYGWEEADLVGKSLSTIVPKNMRTTHQVGFSRFLTTKKPRILGKTIDLPILLKDGTIKQAAHTITAEQKTDGWEFKATITI